MRSASWRDRVVHHAVYAAIAPLFEPHFIEHSYANRTGKGTHAAIAAYERFRDRHAFVLRCDIFRYFPGIDHAVLKSLLRRKIDCSRTLALLDRIIDGSNAQEPVEAYFPGDDLFAPFTRRRGLPIGNLTSQFFANIYLDPLDHFVTETLGADYVRYVDDFALFAASPVVLGQWRDRLVRFLEGLRLRPHPRKTWIASNDQPTEFLGLVLLPDGRRRLPEGNVRRFRNRLRSMRTRLVAGTLSNASATSRIRSWAAHAQHADTWRLRHSIFNRQVPALGGPADWGLARHPALTALVRVRIALKDKQRVIRQKL